MVSIATDDLLHPEILSRETLIDILLQRQIKLNNSQRLDKEVLVDIFHRTVTPLAQREPRLNRRGKVTAKKIKRLYGKRSFKLDHESKGQESDGKAKSSKYSQKGGLLMSADIPSSKPRLKPPPVVTNRGIIKLNSSSSTTSSEKSSSSSKKSKSSLEGGVAKISLKSPAIVSQSKKESRKRPSTETSSSDSPTATDSSPKKIKKITWP